MAGDPKMSPGGANRLGLFGVKARQPIAPAFVASEAFFEVAAGDLPAANVMRRCGGIARRSRRAHRVSGAMLVEESLNCMVS